MITSSRGRIAIVAVLAGALLAWSCQGDIRAPSIIGPAGGGDLGAGDASAEVGATPPTFPVADGGTTGRDTSPAEAGAGDAVGAGDAADAGDVARAGDAADASGSPEASGAVPETGTQTGTTMGTIVPLYTPPSDSSWTTIVTAQEAHPSVRVVAVVNPNSGPGAARNNSYTTGIAKLVAAKIRVIGYVATGYAGQSIASMQTAIDRWKAFYPLLEGIFFDEQSNRAGDVAYYRTLSQYAKAQGLPYTVGNPGADTAEAFVGVLDTMVIYESKGVPLVSRLAGWHAKYAPANFGVIPYGTAFDAEFVREARKYVGYIYLQNDDLPNPWDTLPSYFADLLAALER